MRAANGQLRMMEVHKQITSIKYWFSVTYNKKISRLSMNITLSALSNKIHCIHILYFGGHQGRHLPSEDLQCSPHLPGDPLQDSGICQ